MKPAALKPRPVSADIKRRPAPATSREWDSTVNDLSEYRLSEKQLQAKVQLRHASSKVTFCPQVFDLSFSRAAGFLPHLLTPPQIDYNPLAELQKWEEIQRKEDASFSSAGRRSFNPPPPPASPTILPPLPLFSPTPPCPSDPLLLSASSLAAPPPTLWTANGTRQASGTIFNTPLMFCHVV